MLKFWWFQPVSINHFIVERAMHKPRESRQLQCVVLSKINMSCLDYANGNQLETHQVVTTRRVSGDKRVTSFCCCCIFSEDAFVPFSLSLSAFIRTKGAILDLLLD